jgi:hypothetical protein
VDNADHWSRFRSTRSTRGTLRNRPLPERLQDLDPRYTHANGPQKRPTLPRPKTVKSEKTEEVRWSAVVSKTTHGIPTANEAECDREL